MATCMTQGQRLGTSGTLSGGSGGPFGMTATRFGLSTVTSSLQWLRCDSQDAMDASMNALALQAVFKTPLRLEETDCPVQQVAMAVAGSSNAGQHPAAVFHDGRQCCLSDTARLISVMKPRLSRVT